ncbi:hypothetical protein [Dictyobacter aurantiacus]|uniref:Uncharacterized protein n=1 Tax=Dictyobacter aurantiacus TaxID=1936993 RepID=A0A401ZN07_9CHLR|nr:hypothetical protein [Dictyobacter aurantiacus]GCE08146.1 hypothetical protein KDAU_54750 [Dictyobacter aurantiacus]
MPYIKGTSETTRITLQEAGLVLKQDFKILRRNIGKPNECYTITLSGQGKQKAIERQNELQSKGISVQVLRLTSYRGVKIDVDLIPDGGISSRFTIADDFTPPPDDWQADA